MSSACSESTARSSPGSSLATASSAMSSWTHAGPARSTYSPIRRALSAMNVRISLSRGVIEHHRLARDPRRQ